MSAVAGRRRLVVAAATYRRPPDLERCLRTVCEDRSRFLAANDGWDVAVLIVDNDADAGGRPVVERCGSPEVRYVVEPEPGISAARNRALDESSDADLLVFIDDDEEPLPGWLGHLVDTYERYRPAAVVGRVVSAFPTQPEEWIDAGGFFKRRSLPTGTRVDVAATNNLLLDLRTVRDLGLRFEARYGLTGGGDTAFTRRLAMGGGVMVWCDEAVVVDHVPASRLTRHWVLARARRTGNGEVVVGLDLTSSRPRRLALRAKGLGRGLIRLGAGSVQAVAGRVTGSVALSARGAKAFNRGRGMTAGAVGRRVSEYHRPVAGARPGPR